MKQNTPAYGLRTTGLRPVAIFVTVMISALADGNSILFKTVYQPVFSVDTSAPFALLTLRGSGFPSPMKGALLIAFKGV